ncbi:tetratricopeptide repeat protein [Bernardetia sp. ABR2-2B]|uniref:tetratricopeptide repeat-containing sensor histidine kinase n=1 Tax=Bernardetia sp. ABR2-2B TaxID=3127472 RepID=UPI0030D30CC8
MIVSFLKKLLLLFSSLFLFTVVYADDDLKEQKMTQFQKDSIYISTELMKAQQLAYPKPDSAELIINEVIAYSKKKNSDFGLMSGYLTLGIVKFIQEDLEKCKEYLETALELSKKLKNEKAKISILNNLGNYYYKKNILDKALDYYLVSLELDKKQPKAELATSYINIGILYKKMKAYTKAEEYFYKTFSAYSKVPKITSLYSYMNLAELYQEIENYERVLSLADTVYKLGIQTKMQQGIGASFTYKATSLYEFKKYHKALVSIDSALAYFPKNAPQRYKVLLDKSKILIKLEKYDQAESILLELTPVLEEFLGKKKVALLYLSEIYKKKNQFEKSLAYFEKYKVADDTLKVQEQRQEVANLFVKYETEEKEAAIQKLNQEAKIKDLELKNSYYIIAGSVVLGFIILIAVWIFFRQKNIIDTFEKEQAKLRWRRAQINPHFFFNVLSAIQMLVYEQQTEKVSKYITGFSYLMRQVLEGSNQEKVSLEEEIKFLTTYLTLEKLSLDFDFEIIEEAQNQDEELEIEDIFIPTMLLQPFVENAIEHGLRKSDKENKKLDIKFIEVNQHTLQISIKDNGAGRNQERKKQHISRALEITQDRKKLMKDVFDYEIIDNVDSNQNSLGTEVIFTINI